MAPKKKKPSNWDGKPSTHPERKGELNKSPMKNWVEKKGGLPSYINSVATAIMREKGWARERAIRTAINWAKKTCSTGMAMGGKVKVSESVQRAACAAVKKWESMKGTARVSLTARDDHLSDEDFYALFQVDWNAWDSDDEDESLVDLCEQIHSNMIDLTEEATVGDILQLPVDTTDSSRVGRKLWRKQIMPVGRSIQYNGETLDFTQDLAETLVQNFNEGAFETVPLVLADPDNKHTENPEAMRGEIVALQFSEDGSGLDALIETDPRGSEMIMNNPKMGISPRIFTDYTRPADGKAFGPVLRHGAVTLDPGVYGLKAWEGVDLTNDHGDEVIDLSASEYQGGETVENEETNRTEETPAGGETIDLTNHPELKAKFDEAIDLANRALKEKNELEDKLFRTEQEARLQRLGDDGLPKSIIDLARPLVMQRGEGRVIDLTNEQGEKTQKPVADQVFEMLETMKVVPLGEEGRIDLTNTPETDEEAALEALRSQFGTT